MSDLPAGTVIRDRAGEGVLQLLRDAVGYDSNMSYPFIEFANMLLSEYSVETDYMYVLGGLSRVMHAMETAAKKSERVDMRMCNEVICLQKNDNYCHAGGATTTDGDTSSDSAAADNATTHKRRYQLTVWDRRRSITKSKNEPKNDAGHSVVQDHHRHQNEDYTIHADAVILCVPRCALEQIEGFDTLFGAARRRGVRVLIDAVLPSTGLKIVVRYQHAWWRQSFGARVKVVSDLPFRMAVLEADNPGDDEEERDDGEADSECGGTVLARTLTWRA